ncbi:hydroxymethylpyrimidine/phosphomethylpyrimidine kinase [Aquimarina addita]|uniref:hydroxymethylpyrimidine kinase n=1 Tax=Aquimarina addita TaxID=870485 RepID=A0ABP7XHQ6_9FLAO
MEKRPYILTIAGFDPSGGAGITADVKTMEALKGYGLAVCTANTVQTDILFDACFWTDIEVIKNQIKILFDRFEINFVKIGIIQNLEVLAEVIDFVLVKNNNVKIVLDPVLNASSDFDFQKSGIISEDTSMDSEKLNHQLDEILKKIYLLTPNYQEIEKLYMDKTIADTISHIKSKTNLLLKGGHRTDCRGVDVLFTKEGKKFEINPETSKITEKHGSGCILSSAITVQLAMGFSLPKACLRGKLYTEKVLSSTTDLLGYHNI